MSSEVRVGNPCPSDFNTGTLRCYFLIGGHEQGE